MSNSFSAQIESWSEKTRRNAELVVKQSAQDVFEIAQTSKAKGGNMPVKTGTLKNSLSSSVNGGAESKGPESYTLAIAEMDMGDVMLGFWDTTYAHHQEYGTKHFKGNFFMRGAAQQWQDIANKNAARLK